MKKVYRFFGGFLEAQTNFLNKKASEGYRLVNVGNISYEFEECKPNEYQYVVDFVADKNYKDSLDYKSFLEDVGYKVFYKNLNINNAIMKVKWRPFAKKGARIATKETTYNKELVIVEREYQETSFELHTTKEDRIDYYNNLRNINLTPFILGLFLMLYLYFNDALYSFATLLIVVLVLNAGISIFLYQKKVAELKKE